MKDHFVLEAFWVVFTYGWVSLACGLAISVALVVWGSRRVQRRSRMAILAAATLILWIALIVGVEYGYNAWQSIPNPPNEAFSDTGGPSFMLFLGWLPSFAFLGTGHLLLRLNTKRNITSEQGAEGDAVNRAP